MSSSVVGIVWDALLLLDAELLADPGADWYEGTQDQTDALYAELLGIWDDFGGTPSLSAEGLVDRWFDGAGSLPPSDSCLSMPPWLCAGIMMGVPGFPTFS
jgi:hypothetical protein